MKFLFDTLRVGQYVTLYLNSGAQVYGRFTGLDPDWRYVDLDVSFATSTKHAPPDTRVRVLLAHVIAVSHTTDPHDRSKEIKP